jgi:hypothetical protein
MLDRLPRDRDVKFDSDGVRDFLGDSKAASLARIENRAAFVIFCWLP